MGAERRGRVIRGLAVVGQPRRNRRGRDWEWEHQNHRASRSIFRSGTSGRAGSRSRRIRAPGVDGQSIADFEKDLKNNLYKVWNRMSSGSYFPLPVRAVEIEKPHGEGMRTLGIPTVADRIAQTVVAKHLEERVEPVFHPDSSGYRPGRSAHDAVETARRRGWQYDLVLDLDIRAVFATVPWEHVLAAVAAHTDAAWVLLYVKRWLAAPLQHPDGTRIERDRGTPQGSPVSPVLANLFGHCALDVWLTREHPAAVFERYADDVLVHCTTRAQTQVVLAGIEQRLRDLGMAIHPDKTTIVYCRDGKRRGRFPVVSFTFLGFLFSPAPEQEPPGGAVRGVPARDQPAAPDQDRPGGPPLAAAPADLLHLRGAGPRNHPDRGGVDGLLRAVLPLEAVRAPGAHQCLPGALDRQQVPTAGSHPGRPRQTRRAGRRPAPAVPALGLGHQRLAVRRTRAR